MNKFILLTGATGFIGSHVAERLLQDQAFQVVTIVRKKRAYKNVEKLASGGAHLVEGNFYDKTLLETIFRDFPIQYVIHIAAIRGEGFGGPEEYHRVNVLGTEALLNASLNHGVKRFIFCSSVGVLGTTPSQLPGTLETPLRGDTLYHQSKILSEEKVQDFVHLGLDAYIVRPTITYGEGDRGFSFKLVNLMRKRLSLFLPCDNMVHILDVKKLAEIFTKIITTTRTLDQRILIAADREPVKLRELADLINEHYFNKSYQPSFTIPEQIYKGALHLAKLFVSGKWKTRMQLISSSWHYDVAVTSACLDLPLADTRKEFKTFLETLIR